MGMGGYCWGMSTGNVPPKFTPDHDRVVIDDVDVSFKCVFKITFMVVASLLLISLPFVLIAEFIAVVSG
jgi:hypothetical protein